MIWCSQNIRLNFKIFEIKRILSVSIREISIEKKT